MGIQARFWLQEACHQGSWWPQPEKSRQEWGWGLEVDLSPPMRQRSCQPPTAGLFHSLPAPQPVSPMPPETSRPLCAMQMVASVNKTFLVFFVEWVLMLQQGQFEGEKDPRNLLPQS